MSEPTTNGQRFEKPENCFRNDEIPLDMNSLPSLPITPRSEKYLATVQAERAKMARCDPEFRAELERLGIKLTPEELGETEPLPS